MINQHFLSILQASTDLTGLIQAETMRAFPFGMAPQGVEYPYLTFQNISGTPENYINNAPDIDNFTIQVDIWGKTGATASAVALAARDAIEQHAHITSWRGESFEPGTKTFRISFDVSIFINR